jgi:ribosomal protein L11 methylase PrmA
LSFFPDPASFRDPKGKVFKKDDRIFRLISEQGVKDYELVKTTNFLSNMSKLGKIIQATEVDPAGLDSPDFSTSVVLEHPRLPFISYPYEWCFPMLKKAAQLHLELQIKALEENLMFSDASAYNIQFQGPQPIFIDVLSLRPYREGQIWDGHRQFCEQFLNPLLLRSLLGVCHNSWYRGNLEGIPSDEFSKLLPWYKKFSKNIFLHVVLPVRMNNLAQNQKTDSLSGLSSNLPKVSLKNIFTKLLSWVSELQPLYSSGSTWGSYDSMHCYQEEEVEKKQQFISEFIQNTKPKTVWDLGCNTGEYSEIALKSGARHVIGFDYDQTSLEKAFTRADNNNLNLLPLYLDGANPSPSQGWNNEERPGLLKRKNADAVLALAFEHHLTIGRNIPIPQFLEWLISLAPIGVVEFIPKEDPNLQRMLSLREDIFTDYTEKTFRNILERKCKIIKSTIVSKTGRTLFWYEATK